MTVENVELLPSLDEMEMLYADGYVYPEKIIDYESNFKVRRGLHFIRGHIKKGLQNHINTDEINVSSAIVNSEQVTKKPDDDSYAELMDEIIAYCYTAAEINKYEIPLYWQNKLESARAYLAQGNGIKQAERRGAERMRMRASTSIIDMPQGHRDIIRSLSLSDDET